MGYSVGATCYPTALAANVAAGSAQSGAVVSAGSSVYVVELGTVTASSIQYRFVQVGGSQVVTKVATSNPPPCGLIEWGDTLELSWAVVAAWAAAYGVRFLATSLRSRVEYDA